MTQKDREAQHAKDYLLDCEFCAAFEQACKDAGIDASKMSLSELGSDAIVQSIIKQLRSKKDKIGK